jgi:fructosamine-3-kinase
MIWTSIREQEPSQEEVMAVAEGVFQTRPTSAELVPDAGFAYVYRLLLPGKPCRAIIKWQHHSGRSVAEARQLQELRKHAITRVLEVYLCDPQREVLVLEHIPGALLASTALPAAPLAEGLADEIVSALLAWHAVQHPPGFGPFDGPYHSRWADHFRERVLAYHGEIRLLRDPEQQLDDSVLGVAERSLTRMRDILGGATNKAVLVHSDCHLSNLLVDPTTSRLTGIIDPLDAEWADPEVDLINWGWPTCPRADTYHLLATYQQRAPLREGAELRCTFYQFWRVMGHLARIGWHYPPQDRQVAEALDQAMLAFL